MVIPREPLPSKTGENDVAFKTTYSISGFRSLNEFQICLENGLNVLVGSNGAGKTNFIDFLDFLSTMIRLGGATAISKAGGIARVFSQEALKKKIPRLIARVSGTADVRDHLRRETKSRRTLFDFDYEVEFRYSKSYSSVFIFHECLKFKGLFGGNLSEDRFGTVGSIDLKRKSPVDEDGPNYKVGPYLLAASPRNPLKFPNRYRLSSSDEESRILTRTPAIEADQSFLNRLDELPAIAAVIQALSRGKSFNLNPNQARIPDDISQPPFIDANGNGLSSTLYQMSQASKSRKTTPFIRARRFRPDMMEQIVNWTRLVLPELKDVNVVADPHTGKYLAYLIIESDDQDLRIPLQSASDGTLKWLAFVALILSQGRSYTFEEPENFLHPKMQRFLIDLIREEMERLQSPGHFILSTHSETVINQCRPEELILFEFKNGRTTACRLERVDNLRDEINRTGFGLGYYYAANAIS